MFCAYTTPRYQVSVYRTVGPLVSDCGLLPQLANGLLSQTGTTVFHESTYNCALGYKLGPDVGLCKRICLNTGEWSGIEPACIQGNTPNKISNWSPYIFTLV